MSQSLPPVVGTGTSTDPVVLPDVNVTTPKIVQPNTGPSGNSYIERALTFQFFLGKGPNGEGVGDAQFQASNGAALGNTVTVNNVRAHCTINFNGPPSLHTAEMRIYGLQPSIMNGLSSLGKPRPMQRYNTVTVFAGDTASTPALVFTGLINECWQNFDGMPETFLEVQSMIGLIEAMKPIQPSSFPGSADAAVIMASLATIAGRNFSNSGVSVMLSNPYYAGTALDQMHAVARDANIGFDDDGTTIWIWPKTNGCKNGVVPLISPASGLIGYPRWTSSGISLRTIYNPNIQFAGQVQVQNAIDPATGLSELPRADGTWFVRGLSHDLSSQLPGGPWFTDIDCDRLPGGPATTPATASG